MESPIGCSTTDELISQIAASESAWIELNRDALMADWELARSGQLPYKIDPL